MTTTRRNRFAATLAAFVGAAILIAPPAGAQESTTSTTMKPRPPREQPRERPPAEGERREQAMDEIKSRCLNQIELRQRAMAAAKRRLAQARFVTDSHEAALVQNIDATAASLSRLADTIQGEDNFEELRAECRSIVVDHRVFVLVLPRVRLVVASDAELAAARRLTDAATKFQAEIDKQKAEGKDTTEAESDLARMRAHTQSAHDHAVTVFDSVIGITPADYNANPNVLDAARTEVRAAKEDLRAAMAAAREVRHDLYGDSKPS